MAKQTPMMRQYLEIKSQYPDSILLFRLGDFYEMFLDDAVTASRILDITLTSRNKGAADEVPLCGIPYHSLEGYLAKLVESGHKVAICEQVEDPQAAKGIVKREVVRVVTPGTLLESSLLNAAENNYFAVIAASGEDYGVALMDISTGEFRTTQVSGAAAAQRELAAIAPREVLCAEDRYSETVAWLRQAGLEVMCNRLPQWLFDAEDARRRLEQFFAAAALDVFGCATLPLAIIAAGAALYYAEQTQKSAVAQIRTLKTWHSDDYMLLDEATRRNLELTATMLDGKRRGSLLWALDRTVTAMGARKLRQWLTQPLLDCARIGRRHALVAELVEQATLRANLRAAMDEVHDLERLCARVDMAGANARDLLAMRLSLEKLPLIKQLATELSSDLGSELAAAVDPLDDVAQLIAAAIADDPPLLLREGGLMRSGYNAELDELRAVSSAGKGWIARLQHSEREATGITTLKVRYNKVFGYFIEVPRTQVAKVPEHYQRKQTLANSERYFTAELKEYEDKVLGAEDKLVALEYELFQQLRQQVAQHGARIQRSAAAIARLDALAGLADIAHERNYCRPLVDDSCVLHIEEGRHPVIECMSLDEQFIPNDVLLDGDEQQLLIITGPNMAGKSTFMRQVALITLMAQIGSFVPAKSARIGVADRIFTRVGASDNLAAGQSTFMVEMSETANILNHASGRSLVILDEIGRGTSTFDGISIAWAVAEYLHDNRDVAARTLFATHYHELTELENSHERIRNFNVAVREWNDEIVFLRRIVPGGASHSYGIQVARLAGLPAPVIARAKEVLHNLEGENLTCRQQPRSGQPPGDSSGAALEQMTLFASGDERLRQKIAAVDVNCMTPVAALNFVNELKQFIEEDQ